MRTERAETRSQTSKADSKGRVSLGKDFADALLIMEYSDDGSTVVLRKAQAIPASEAWLFRNKEASRLVQEGLSDIRAGRVTKGPDLEADSSLADEIDE